MGRSISTDSQSNPETSSGDESHLSTASEPLPGTSHKHGGWLSFLPSRISGLLASHKAGSTDTSKVRYRSVSLSSLRFDREKEAKSVNVLSVCDGDAELFEVSVRRVHTKH